MPVELSRELEYVPPLDGGSLLGFLGRRCIAGVESYELRGAVSRYARTVGLAHGPAVIALSWDGHRLRLTTHAAPADEPVAVRIAHRLCDLEADASAIDDHLVRDPVLRPLVVARPGLRVPGSVDTLELAFRALIGQQVSLAAAATCAAKLTDRYGEPVDGPGTLSRLFPTAAALAEADPADLPMPRTRGRALVELARRLADGTLDLGGDLPWPQRRAALLATPGIGPWTADYIALRGLGDPDVLLSTDLVIKRELVRRGVRDTTPWAPWRSYATLHLGFGSWEP
jgi:AraC family transcriptional regulator, regulatory protein of adaptative response / DNA-3-methyladenine glycosylase II